MPLNEILINELTIDMLEVISEINYTELFMNGTKVGLILGGSICIMAIGVNIALKFFKII